MTLFDNTMVTPGDLGSNFYTNQSHVGNTTRADASVGQLKELNPHVTVEVLPTLPTPQQLGEYNLVVLTDVWDQNYIREANEMLRKKGSGLIVACVSGLFGSTFVDYGEV